MLNYSGWTGHPCLLPGFREKVFSFSSLSIMLVWRSHLLRNIPYIPRFLRVSSQVGAESFGVLLEGEKERKKVRVLVEFIKETDNVSPGGTWTWERISLYSEELGQRQGNGAKMPCPECVWGGLGVLRDTVTQWHWHLREPQRRTVGQCHSASGWLCNCHPSRPSHLTVSLSPGPLGTRGWVTWTGLSMNALLQAYFPCSHWDMGWGSCHKDK